MKEKLKSPRFWTALAGILTMILLAVGVRIPAPVVNEIIGTVSAVLVLLGFIKPPDDADKADGEPKSGEESEENLND